MSDWRLINADVLAGLASLPDNSVHTVVTSPPYYGLRSYGTERWEGGSADCDHKADVRPRASRERGALSGGLDYIEAQNDGSNAYKDTCGKCGAHRIDQQIGLEATPAEFVATMVRVFAEVKRVLRPDGTLWLNLGDSYARQAGDDSTKATDSGLERTGRTGKSSQLFKQGNNAPPQGLKPKDLMMMPARVALALQDDGWWLRSDIIWCKRAPMPESVTDRPTSAHEHIFLLTKSGGYYYDADAVREQGLYGRKTYPNGNEDLYGRTRLADPRDSRGNKSGVGAFEGTDTTRNLWNYWLLSPEPYAEAHFATFPTEIPRRAILAGTSERGCCGACGAPWRRVVEKWGGRQQDVSAARGIKGAPGQKPMDASNHWDGVPRGSILSSTTGWQATCKHDAPIVPCTVLDPFAGAGTTLLVASRLGRRSIGIELSPEYCRMAEKRIESDPASMNMRMELIEATA